MGSDGQTVTRGSFLDWDTVDQGDLDAGALEAALPALRRHPYTAPDQVAGRIADAQVAITNKVVLDAERLAGAPDLKLVCITATGTNNVDLGAAAERGITVCNVRAYATASVVEHVFALILSLTRRLEEYAGAVRAGRWQQASTFALLDYPVRELTGKLMGIVGYGELGQAVAGVARAFGMEVQVAQRPGGDSRPGRVPLHELLPRADVLTLHTPLTPETRGLIGARELALMKPDALLINTARGGIVDEAALADALTAGRLGGAGVDVLAEEPPVGGSPLLELSVPRLIVTPHVAWASREARQRVVDETVANIRAFQAGEPRNTVT